MASATGQSRADRIAALAAAGVDIEHMDLGNAVVIAVAAVRAFAPWVRDAIDRQIADSEAKLAKAAETLS